MALVTPDCFSGLPLQRQGQQIFEALYETASNVGAPVDQLSEPSCFEGMSTQEQLAEIYHALYLINQNT